MVDLLGVGTCTASLASVCLGDDTQVMEMDHLTLAEYRACPDSTYPPCFGGHVPYAPNGSPAVDAPSVDYSALGFVSVQPENIPSSLSSGYSNISRSSYEMLERYCIFIFLIMFSIHFILDFTNGFHCQASVQYVIHLGT